MIDNELRNGTHTDPTHSTLTHRELSCTALTIGFTPVVVVLALLGTFIVALFDSLLLINPKFTVDDKVVFLLLLLGVPTGAVVTRLQLLAIAAPLITSAVAVVGSSDAWVLLLLLLLFFFFLLLVFFVTAATDTGFVVLSGEHLHTVGSWRESRGGKEKEQRERDIDKNNWPTKKVQLPLNV